MSFYSGSSYSNPKSLYNYPKMGIASNDVVSEIKTDTNLHQIIKDAHNFTTNIILDAHQEHKENLSNVEQKVNVAIGIVGLLFILFALVILVQLCKKYSCNVEKKNKINASTRQSRASV